MLVYNNPQMQEDFKMNTKLFGEKLQGAITGEDTEEIILEVNNFENINIIYLLI